MTHTATTTLVRSAWQGIDEFGTPADIDYNFTITLFLLSKSRIYSASLCPGLLRKFHDLIIHSCIFSFFFYLSSILPLPPTFLVSPSMTLDDTSPSLLVYSSPLVVLDIKMPARVMDYTELKEMLKTP